MHFTLTPHSLMATLSIALSALSAPLAADTIVLKSAIRLPQGATVVKLADIATLDGVDARALSEVKVADASTSPFELRLDAVRDALSAAHANFAKIDLSGRVCIVRPSATVVAIAQAPKVAAEKARITAPESNKAIIDPLTVIDDSTPLGVCAQLFVARLSVRGLPLRLECSPEDLAKFAPREGQSADVLPRNSLEDEVVDVELIFRRDGRVIARDHVRIEPKLQTACGVVVMPLERGARIAPSDLRTELRWLSPKASEHTLTLHDAAGRIARNSVTAGTALLSTQVKDEVVVHKNDKVIVRREVGLIAIELDAIAAEEGAVGDRITLRSTGKSTRGARNAKPAEFIAEITGPGTAILRGPSTESARTAVALQGAQ